MGKRRYMILVLLGFLLQSSGLFGQNPPFNILLKPLTIKDLPGIQSFAFGQHEGKWLILGGRIDGLHRKQPFAAFKETGENKLIYVVDPVAKKSWSAPLTSLPISIQEQLCSTNMEYFQHGDYLYFIGGYGFSATIGDHTTYSNLTAINVPATIDAVVHQKSINVFFRQITDTLFAVTGGHLGKINDTYYLVGGQKFLGRYNPMGPNHGPGFIQEYTNQIRKFNLTDDGSVMTINHLPGITDSTNLHRRDLNVVPQISPTGEEGLTAFSGVFQYEENLPFLNCVNIDSSGYETNNSFTQYYNQYHCANIPIYSRSKNEMHTLFFGGISQYYDDSDTLTQDNNVPFVRTIARVTRTADGKMAEYKLPIEMPALLGSDAVFIENEDLPKYSNGVIQLDKLANDTTLLGYIYGGIASTEENIFWINAGTQSEATNQIFKVYLTKGANSPIHRLNNQSTGSLKMTVSTYPIAKKIIVYYNLNYSSDVRISFYDVSSKKLEKKLFSKLSIGENSFEKKINNLDKGGTFIVTIETDQEKAIQKIRVIP